MQPTFAELLRSAFEDYVQWLSVTDWIGRENEVVNQFAHRILPDYLDELGPLRSLTQIGIEVAVPQVGRSDSLAESVSRHKRNVRKDLVIWEDGSLPVYDDQWRVRVAPLVVIEWKARTTRLAARDIEWLSRFVESYPQALGVAVSVGFKPVSLTAQFITSEGVSEQFSIQGKE